jgi:hypothetical protein
MDSREAVSNRLFNTKFWNVAKDMKQLFKENLEKQQEEDIKKLLQSIRRNYTDINTNKNNLYLIDQKISKIPLDTINYNKNMNGGHYNYSNNTNMKNIKELCKANQIKLSRVVNGMRVVYTKKELITKLKKKKII